MFELKNPDFTKTPEERDAIRKTSGDWQLWWNIEHQYPYQSRTLPIRRKWKNPFYCIAFATFWKLILGDNQQLIKQLGTLAGRQKSNQS